MKTVLVTGVAGFVGSNLAAELLKRGYRVKGVDDLSQGLKRNLEAIIEDPHFSFYQADVCDQKNMNVIGEDADYIAHLAAFKIPRYGGASKTLLVNTKGTEAILEIARKNKTRVLFSSTSDVYGKNPSLPFSEESDLLFGPTKVGRWAYAVSKTYDEHLCLAYCDEYNVPVSIVRYFGGYGPHQNLSWQGGPQAVFIDCALRKKAIPIHGDGKQTRSFVYISDMIDGTILAMEKDEAIAEVFNIGNPQEISILELAQVIWAMVRNDKPLIEFVPYKNFSRSYEDVSRRVPDIAKAVRLLGFNPKIKLEDGLRLTIDWQKQYIGI